MEHLSSRAVASDDKSLLDKLKTIATNKKAKRALMDIKKNGLAAVPKRVRRADLLKTGRGAAAVATWIFRGDESQQRRGSDVDISREETSRDRDAEIRSRPARASGTPWTPRSRVSS